RRRPGAGIRHPVGDRWRHRVQLAAERRRRVLLRRSAAWRSPGCCQLEGWYVPGDDSYAGQGAVDDRCRRGDVRGGPAMTPVRALLIAVLAIVPVIGARPGAEAQFPRGLLAAPPEGKDPGGA